MDILIDERIELITVVQSMCNYWENFQIKYCDGKPLCSSKYRKNVIKYFSKYNEHKIFKLYETLSNDINDISAFLILILCYSYPPEMNIIAKLENNDWENISGKTVKPYKDFIDVLRQFYLDTKFKEFYKNNKNEYQNMLINYGNKNELTIKNTFEYYGIKSNNYKIILNSLMLDGCGFGINIKTLNNKLNNYSIICPYGYEENNYLFGPLTNKQSYLWHEIGHLIINNLTNYYIKQFDIGINNVPEIYLKNLINNKETIINEYIIRAITIRLFEINNDIKYSNILIEKDKKQSFKNIEKVKDYIKINCEENQKFNQNKGYKELIEYIIKLI